MSDSDLNSECENSSSSSSESADEDLEELLEDRIRPKNQNYLNLISNYNEAEFIEHFRISNNVVRSIADGYENSAYYNYQGGNFGKLSSLHQTYIYLWFVGHQTASFRDVADRFNITISSLHRVINRMTNYISNLSNQIIKWPTSQERNNIENYFRSNGFPGVVGVIDGTHIKIDKPADDPDSYINRKGFYSIQVQLVCDHELRIRDVFLGYPGSVHDSRVFTNSPLCETLVEKCQNNYILGDSGYPLMPNLLTPFRDRGQLTRQQSNYNKRLSGNRYVVEHCIGLLKQKFRQLFHIKLRKIPEIVHLIRACCVLHNLAIHDKFQYQENNPAHNNIIGGIDLHDADLDEEAQDRSGIQIRNNVVNMLM